MKRTRYKSTNIRCLPERRLRLLKLAEIMDLQLGDDLIYTCKILGMAFRIEADLIASKHNDPELGADVLQLCEESIPHRWRRRWSPWANKRSNSHRSKANVRFIFGRRFRLLSLAEIMDLEISDEITYTVKVVGMAFKIITDYASDELNEKDLGAEILSICEETMSHDCARLVLPHSKGKRLAQLRASRSARKALQASSKKRKEALLHGASW